LRHAATTWHIRYNGGGQLTKFGYFAVGSFRPTLREASRIAELEYPVSPFDFGTDNAPSCEDVRKDARSRS